MSTFFDKLSGVHTPYDQEPTVELAAVREAVRPRMRPGGQSTQIKVEEEEKASPRSREPAAEEEGELTVDIYDKGDSIIIQSTVAGVKPEDLDISITNDTVTIRGKRETQDEVSGESYYYKELFWGVFSRSVILPEEIEEDAAEAHLKHGLLTLRLPKRKKGVVQKVKVKVA